jgi:hypothetical protein
MFPSPYNLPLTLARGGDRVGEIHQNQKLNVMNTINKLFQTVISHGGITIVQKGFLYTDRVDTRRQELTFKDFVVLTRYLLENKYLKISLEIEGEDNVNKVLEDLKNIGLSVEVLRKELFWIIELDSYEVDLILSIDLPEDQVKKLIEGFYIVPDAVLVYPVGYISWAEHFQKKPHLV